MENKVVDQYIHEFEIYLKPLTKEERSDVLEFYREYIIDANLDSMDKIHNKLGTPRNLARRVLADYSIKMSEQNYPDVDNVHMTDNQKMKRNMSMIGWIILALFATPIAVPAAIALIAVVVLFVIAAVFFTLLFIFLVALSVVGAIGSIVIGILVIFQSFNTMLFYVGIGIAVLGLDFIIIPMIIAFCKWVFDVLVLFFRWVGKKLIPGRDSSAKEDKTNA